MNTESFPHKIGFVAHIFSANSSYFTGKNALVLTFCLKPKFYFFHPYISLVLQEVSSIPTSMKMNNEL